VKTLFSKYPMQTLRKYAGWANLVLGFAFMSKLVTVPLLRRPLGPELFGYFTPFGLGATLGVMGALGCLSLVVGLALLKSWRRLTIYPGMLLCVLVVAYQVLWGITSFNPHGRPPFKMMSIMMPAGAFLLYGLFFVFLVRLSKGKGVGLKEDGSKALD